MALRKYNVFFAIPWDAATKSMYDTIKKNLEEGEFKDNFDFQMGTTSVESTQPDFSNIEQLKIEAFKAQNQDFLTRFVHVIESSDIIVADMTNNNASVHVELGIALTLNKNIFRVTGRNLIDIATDLRGYEVKGYTSQQELHNWIANYLRYFLHIKQQPPKLIDSNWHDFSPIDIKDLDSTRAKTELGKTQSIWAATLINSKTRDSEIQVSFKFIETFDEEDWFGILLRNETASPWAGGGSFVYARLNGRLEIHNIPVRGVPLKKPKEYDHLGKDQEKEHVLRVNLDGKYLYASLDEELKDGINVDTVEYQSPGNIYLVCYRSFVRYGNIELAQHDTIAFRTDQ